METAMHSIGTTGPGTWPGHRLRGTRARLALALVGVLALAAGCDDGPTGPGTGASTTGDVTGVVRVSATSVPVAGAVVSIGEASTTTGQDGRYHLMNLPAGAVTIRVSATGFATLETRTSIPDYPVTRDLLVERLETFEFGDYALYAPANVRTVRAVLVALGGPDTRGFVTGGVFGAPVPEVEAALGDLGGRFRTLARSREIAVLGTSLSAMLTAPASDEAIAEALRQAATLSARPELAEAPLLLYGISGGAPEAAGFTARNPERVAALFLKVPESIDPGLGVSAPEVPAYMVLAELDAFIDNGALGDAFRTIRRAGGLWAAVTERNVPHHSLSAPQRTFTLDWMDATLELRLPRRIGEALRPIDASAGWVGEQSSGDIVAATEFSRDVLTSWLPSEGVAEQWQSLGALRGPTGVTLVLDPGDLYVSVGRIVTPQARVFDANGRKIETPAITVSSNAGDVIRLLNDTDYCAGVPGCSVPVILAVSPGFARITAEYEGAADEVEVEVVPAMGTIAVDPLEATVHVGETILLTAQLLDSLGEPFDTSLHLTWYGFDTGGDWGVTLASISPVAGSNGWQQQITALGAGTVQLYPRIDGPIGPDPSTDPMVVITIE